MSAKTQPGDCVMYCSDECERRLPKDGFKPCPICGRSGSEYFCNLVWKACVVCSRERHICVVCTEPNWTAAHTH